MNNIIEISITVDKPINVVWEYWTKPEHIINWNFASPDWHCPSAINDLRSKGSFNYRMEAKDQSMGFDFYGEYLDVDLHHQINYKLGDERKVWITFENIGGKTLINESFETEDENSAEMQKQGWQAILNNFKQYTENN